MTGLEIVGLVSAFFKFFPEVMKLLKMLQKTPQEQHAELIKKIEAEAESLRTTGRPKWDIK